MSSLLPIFVSPQNTAAVASGSGSATEPLGQVSKESSQSSGQALPQAFSQILRAHEKAPALLKQLQALISPQGQDDSASRLPLPEKGFRNLETLGTTDAVEKILGVLQASRIQPSPDDSLLPITDSEALPDPTSPLSTQLLASSFVATNESIPGRAQKYSFEQITSPLVFPSTAIASLEGLQAPGRTLFQGNAFQPTGENPTVGPVRQDLAIEDNFSGKAQVPLLKVLESGTVSHQVPVPNVVEAGSISQQVPIPKVADSGLVPQHVHQEPEVKHPSSALNKKETALTGTILQPVKDVPSGFQQVGRSVLGNETLPNPIPPQVSSPLARPQHVQSNYIPPATALQAEGPAGFTGPGLTNQFSIKPIPGIPSVLNDLSAPVIEHRTTVPVDLAGDSGLLGKGDRAQTMVETSMKSVGFDSSSGQGLGSGMNNFSNSQSGSQQPSFLPGQGMGVRGLEERGQEFPAPALQRLQMDVQLSETQRVQIDVGVHNRQVYTGLVMDHSVLRNLATQFVPQLEQQLADVDLELQEFSAEVREEREQEASSPFDDSRSHKAQESGRRVQGELLSTQNSVGRQQESGLHLVA